jgi:hypothetical protein
MPARASDEDNRVQTAGGRLPLAATGVVSSPASIANGDPASHVVLTGDVFLPSEPVVCSVAGRRLEAMTEATRKAGYPVKVVVIPTAEDLGTLSMLFGRPEAYARQLELELPAEMFEPLDGRRGYRLLILMPAELGLNRAGPKEARALERFSVDAEATESELARLATGVVPRLARAAGFRVAKPRPKPECSDVDSSSSDSGSSSPVDSILIFVAPVAMVALALYLGSRSRARRDAGAEGG